MNTYKIRRTKITGHRKGPHVKYCLIPSFTKILSCGPDSKTLSSNSLALLSEVFIFRCMSANGNSAQKTRNKLNDSRF